MTCIIGMAHEGRVYMGGDSMASDGYSRRQNAARKVFHAGAFLIGYTSSYRMGQILQYHLEVREQKDDELDERYMVVAFIEAVRECLKDKGWAEIDNNHESGGEFLVGYRGHLYGVYPSFQINQFVGGIASVGAGEQYALGAMLALKNLKPEERIQESLKIACQLSALVADPFYVEVL